MGWGSGSTLMSDVIKTLRQNVSDSASRQAIYYDLILSFDDQDWDTHDECVGVDPAFDAALKEHYPRFFDPTLS